MRKVIIMFFLTLFSFTTIAKADESISVNEFANNVASVPGKLMTWLKGEVEKTKAYQTKVWADTPVENFFNKTKKD